MTVTLIALSIALMTLVIILSSLDKRKRNENNRMHTYFILLCFSLIIHISGLVLQIVFRDTSIKPIYFDYITYLGASFTPLIFYYIALIYKDKNINLKKQYYLCYIPVVFTLLVWTNDLHNLFYIEYSIYYSDVVFGPLMFLFAAYSYLLYIASTVIMARTSMRKSGKFSIQTALIILGMMVPVVGNLLGTLSIINSNIYLSPILLIITSLSFYFAIFKLKALNITPVTTRTIMNSMSDAFVVLSEDGTIADINKTFIETFKDIITVKDKDNLFNIIEDSKIINLKEIKRDILKAKKEGQSITKEYHIQKDTFDKYFEIDCQPIKARSGNEYVAYLLLIRDITQAKRDMEIMTKNENLVILGELAGGVAHDINTPISAIKSGLLMLKTTADTDDEKMLIERMDSCANKISNLVNSLRNQIRNIGSDNQTNISISNIIADIKLILHNELTKNKINLNVDIKEEITLLGNSTKLSQVVTNIVMNAIQAYEGKTGDINLSIYKNERNEAIIRIEDFAGGIPESVRPYIFKNILTTKGVSGTGFGLYLAYSVIKGAFGGEITFDTETGKGTVFNIIIPLNQRN